MGYWEQGMEEDPNNQVIWGDAPADIVDGAIWEVTIDFARDLGRMPSKKEIIEGIKFTTNVLDQYADEPRDAPALTDEQQKAIDQHGWAATGGDIGMSTAQREAISKVNEVLKPLYKS